MTITEKNILRKIRKKFECSPIRYDFWFIYDEDNRDKAIGWEGGFGIPLKSRFRNDYSLHPDGTVTKNF